MEYVVVMVGWTGSEYRTPCATEVEAVKLMEHHNGLGFDAWIEMDKED